MQTNWFAATVLAGSLVFAPLLLGSAQAGSVPDLKSAVGATPGVLTLVHSGGGGGGGAGHGGGGGGGWGGGSGGHWGGGMAGGRVGGMGGGRWAGAAVIGAVAAMLDAVPTGVLGLPAGATTEASIITSTTLASTTDISSTTATSTTVASTIALSSSTAAGRTFRGGESSTLLAGGGARAAGFGPAPRIAVLN